MRYKIKAPDYAAYEQLLEKATAAHADVKVASEKRMFLSIEDPSEKLKDDLIELGAEITVEQRFTPERK